MQSRIPIAIAAMSRLSPIIFGNESVFQSFFGRDLVCFFNGYAEFGSLIVAPGHGAVDQLDSKEIEDRLFLFLLQYLEVVLQLQDQLVFRYQMVWHQVQFQRLT